MRASSPPPRESAPRSSSGGPRWPCVASIALLSLPAFAALLLTLRGLAPTRPRAAGVVRGALRPASIAAAAYALHCDESTLSFLATWYVLGIAAPATLGALLGPRLLRWS